MWGFEHMERLVLSNHHSSKPGVRKYDMNINLKKIGPKGSGFFCDVTRYRNEENGAEYAVKTLKKKHYSNDEYRYRLLREIELLKKLSGCEQIIRLLDSGNDKDKEKLWYLMPYAQYNLYKYIKKNNQKLTTDQRFDISNQVIAAIKYSHAKDILHRDISPNNVLVFEKEDKLLIKVCDFGLGKDAESLSFYTRSSASGYGQILYVSPEQRIKLKDATAKSDIYSLGKLLYFIFTGKDPDNLKPFELSSLVSRAIEDNPEDRFENLELFEKHYSALKKLHFEQEIPIEYITLKDLVETESTIDWMHFHQIAVKGNYSDHVYYDYISPTISILKNESKISEYYREIGSDFRNFIRTFSIRIEDCLQTTRWPFSATGSFGTLLKNIIVAVNDAEVRLICFKKLWDLAFVSDQWDVQSSIKIVLSTKYIAKEIEISLADHIQDTAIEVDMSHFTNLDLPRIVKMGIIQSNEAQKKEVAERLSREKDDMDNWNF